MARLLRRHDLSQLTSQFYVPAFVRTSHFRSTRRALLGRATFRMAHEPSNVTLDSSRTVEEENVRGYKAEHYYPVKTGEVFQHRYSVIGKLGYGSASTVWLCHDLSKEYGYVALKVYINCSKVHRELPIYNHINRLHSQYEGRNHIRRLLDFFEISGPHGKHTCLVHEALGMNLEELRDLVPDRMFAANLIRQSLRDILRGLYFLHEEACVIHTGKTDILLWYC